MKRNKISLLFICLGNICRSPAAEGVMRKFVEEAGKTEAFHIDSAGIGNWHVGQLPDRRMRACGQRHGYCFDSHARQISPDDFSRFDILLVMDHDNYRAVIALAPTPEDAQKVHLLTEYITDHKGVDTVPDPYYGGERDFEYALSLIEDACQGLLGTLLQ